MKRVKRLADNEIELGIKIPTIESRASNIPMTKGIIYVVIAVWPIKIFVEYVGTNMSIHVPLLVIDRRCVSVMSTLFSNRRVRTLKVTMTVSLWVYVFWCTEGSSESRIWSRTWRGVLRWSRRKDQYTGWLCSDTRMVSEGFGHIPKYRGVTGTHGGKI